MNLPRLSKTQVATLITLLFHGIGLVGIFTQTDWIIKATPLNLLLSAALLLWTEQERSKAFWIFFILCYTIGMTTEIIGVNTGLLFGNYFYGALLGPQLLKVPLVIGVNWFIVQYCSGHTLLKLQNKFVPGLQGRKKMWSLVVDSALLAVTFDWLIEPVAVRLCYWTWVGGTIPSLNYISWLMISFFLMLFFGKTTQDKPNQFAVHLLMTQVLFFLILRTFLL
jgi:putative membrane protein